MFILNLAHQLMLASLSLRRSDEFKQVFQKLVQLLRFLGIGFGDGVYVCQGVERGHGADKCGGLGHQTRVQRNYFAWVDLRGNRNS